MNGKAFGAAFRPFKILSSPSASGASAAGAPEQVKKIIMYKQKLI